MRRLANPEIMSRQRLAIVRTPRRNGATEKELDGESQISLETLGHAYMLNTDQSKPPWPSAQRHGYDGGSGADILSEKQRRSIYARPTTTPYKTSVLTILCPRLSSGNLGSDPLFTTGDPIFKAFDGRKGINRPTIRRNKQFRFRTGSLVMQGGRNRLCSHKTVNPRAVFTGNNPRRKTIRCRPS